MRIQFSAEALEDASEIFDYLESQQSTLGDEFFSSLADVSRILKENPNAFQKLEGNIRRVQIGKFRYWLFYQADDEMIKIITLIHQSRNPGRYPKP